MMSVKANSNRRTALRPAAGARRARAGSRHAFSIIELLLVVGIIIVLLGIVFVAVNAATRTAQRTNTAALMNSMRQGLIQFESEIGYLPPVLDTQRNLMAPPGWESPLDDPEGHQQWHSVTTLAEYLIGYGPAIHDGRDGLGIRNPGRDGYWGATQQYDCVDDELPDTLAYRQNFLDPEGMCAARSQRYREGQVYGPYIELQDDRLLGAIDPDNLWQSPDPTDPNISVDGIYNVLFPGDPNYDDDLPKVIVDYWGQPIRYYRLPYVGNNPAQAYRQRPHMDPDEYRQPRLSDFFALRPYRIRPGEDTDGIADLNPGAGDFPGADTSTTYRLQTAAFGMLSAGPNRSVNLRMRVDENEDNADNIVELGP